METCQVSLLNVWLRFVEDGCIVDIIYVCEKYRCFPACFGARYEVMSSEFYVWRDPLSRQLTYFHEWEAAVSAFPTPIGRGEVMFTVYSSYLCPNESS